jgi:hypothetical protein
VKASHRADRTGRSKVGSRYVALRHYMLNSPAWRALSFPAKAALIELMKLYNGHNNGQLAMAATILADLLGCSKTHADRALNELEDKGFVGLQKVGTFRRRDRLASEYFLTEYKNDVSGERPTTKFMRWTPPPTVPKNGVTVPPAGREQQNCRPRSHRRDRQSVSGPILGPTGGTHISSYQGGSLGGTRSAPIGSAVASGPLGPAVEAAERENLIALMMSRHGKSRAEAMEIIDAMPNIELVNRTRAS